MSKNQSRKSFPVREVRFLLFCVCDATLPLIDAINFASRPSRKPILQMVNPAALFSQFAGVNCAIKELEERRDMIQVPSTAHLADDSFDRELLKKN